MTAALLVGIAGLAALDSLKPPTLVAVTLILLGSRRRPVPEALGFVLGAFGSVMTVGECFDLVENRHSDPSHAPVPATLGWADCPASCRLGVRTLAS